MSTKKSKFSTKTLTIGAMMTAFVIVFQLLATYTTFFGPFSTAIGLIPIIIGAVLCGPVMGVWLGFVFAFIVLITGGANLFLTFSIHGTLITVLTKGMGCGFVAGIVNKLIKKFNQDIAAIASAILCPIVNTGLFLLGSYIFFLPYASQIAGQIEMVGSGFGVFIAIAMGNFLFEIGLCLVLSPVIVKFLRYTKKG